MDARRSRICGTARAASSEFTVMRTSSEPALASSATCTAVRTDTLHALGRRIIQQAKQVYRDAAPGCLAALEHIEAVARGVQQRYPELLIHCDLSELRGYEYHTGLVFAAFLPGQGREIARGGRYDDIGSVFGVARPATGFSADLLNLYQLANIVSDKKDKILAPGQDDEALAALIADLRKKGERVVVDLSNGEETPQQQGCTQIIIHDGKQWTVEGVK